MTVYGLTSEGFVVKPVSVIKAEIEDQVRANVDQGFNLETSSPWGQLIGIFSSHLGECWEQLAEVRAARDPRNAQNASLDDVCALTGTTREDETFSTTASTVNVNPGTYGPGTLIAYVDGDPSARFSNVETVVNGTAGAASYAVTMKALSAGPVRANSGTLTKFSSTVTGWNSVTNTADAVLGSYVEKDSSLAVRREKELAAQGGSNFDAMVADLSKWLHETLGIATATVTLLDNDTDTTDGNGLTPHSFAVIIYDGTVLGTNVSANAIAQQIWASKPCGIKAVGTSTGTAVDAAGVSRTVAFYRPSVLTLYVEFDVKVDPNVWVDGSSDVALQQAISDWGAANLKGGMDVIKKRLESVALGIPGVWDITATRLGFTASPVGVVNLAVTPFQLAVADTSRVLVNRTLEVPS